ncbi:single-stranded DNA-binding protein [Evansella tamaricis]|uniref:Single-stranded DNA-binding protein n=1 Tax=Evansella tamaricis TaxID=2069301 RepID=A0ABS6JGM3_9BACI|nr:single-stranded DNA-binding protein [Evansella tamaricis]MBU9712797.1 single-stranded DNA-binding protein [Evansella tamaricis]
MLNQVILIGRIVKDPVVNNTKEGTAVTRLTLAVRRPFKNHEGNYDTDFVTCTAWKKLAETSADYCTKGSLVCVTGRVQVRTYDIMENKRMTISEIVAENITFLQLKRNQSSTEIVVPIPGQDSSHTPSQATKGNSAPPSHPDEIRNPNQTPPSGDASKPVQSSTTTSQTVSSAHGTTNQKESPASTATLPF